MGCQWVLIYMGRYQPLVSSSPDRADGPLPDTAAFMLLWRLVLSDHALFLRNFLAISLIYPSLSILALENFLDNFIYISRNVRLMQG